MAQYPSDELKSDLVVDGLKDKLPQTKFQINYKDKDQLVKDIHYVVNHLFPLNDIEYENDTDIAKSNYKLLISTLIVYVVNV